MASHDYPVAVIGMATRLPAASTCDKLWQMIMNSEESIGRRRFPSKRAVDIEHMLQPFIPDLTNKDEPFFTGSYFEQVDKFDPDIFQISDEEALYI